MTGVDKPSDEAMLERARSLANREVWTVALQCRRLRSPEPEDEEFLFRWFADLQFLIVALRRLRRAAGIAADVLLVASDIRHGIQAFDDALPGLRTMRNVGEHIDSYALDEAKRHHKSVNRRMIQSAAFDGTTFHWLGAELNIDEALVASKALFRAVKAAQDRHTTGPV